MPPVSRLLLRNDAGCEQGAPGCPGGFARDADDIQQRLEAQLAGIVIAEHGRKQPNG